MKFRLLAVLTVLFIIISSFAPKFVHAIIGGSGTAETTGITGTIDQPSYVQYQEGVAAGRQSINNETFTAHTLANNLFAFSAQIVGYDGSVPGLQANGGGAVGFFSKSMGTMIAELPKSVGAKPYVQYLASSLKVPGSPTTAYAANGIGYDSLSPLLKVWTVSRNLAYAVFALIFIVVGFMIIFRLKIDPKTVATIQNSLPKIFLALILITFSYAIIGFMIDLMYVLIGLSVNLFIGILDPTKLEEIRTGLIKESIFGVVGRGTIWDVTTNTTGAIGEAVGNFIGNVPGFSGLMGVMASGLAWFVITLAILFALFRTWLSLLGAYIQIILGVITAPLFLMVEAIPGRSVVGTWLRMMFSNILVFPLVTLMILVGTALTTAWSKEPGFVPPLLGGNSPGAIQTLIGLGILLTMPKAINILQEYLKTPPFKYGTAWQEPIQFGGTNTPRLARGGWELSKKDIPGTKTSVRGVVSSEFDTRVNQARNWWKDIRGQ